MNDDADSQDEVLAFLGRSREPMAATTKRPAHRYPCGVGVSRRRPRAQGQARGALSVSRLFDAGKAQSRLRGRDLRSTRPTRRKSIAASSPSPAKPTAGSRSAATARRSNGRSRCAASTRRARSTIWPARSTTRWPMRSAAPSPQRTPSARPVEAEPWIAALGSYIDEHVEAFRAASGDFSGRRNRQRSPQASRAAYERIVPLLRERGRRGLIRRIHGDLHLGNIVLIDGKPVLFDAIEFSDIIASGDVLYDLAFLLMDLLRARAAAGGQYRAQPLPRRDAPRPKTSTGWRRCRSSSSMRAAIRAKVTAARHGARDSGRAGRDRQIGARLFRLRPARDRAARAEIHRRRRPLRHRQDRGWRATLAPHVAPMPGAVIVRSDVERKALFGVGETEKLPADAYTPAVDRARLCRRRRQGAPHPCRRTFGDRRCGVRPAAGTRRHRRGGKGRQRSAARAVSHRESGDPTRPRRRPRRTTPPMPTRSVARAQENYDLGRARLDARSTLPARSKTPWHGPEPRCRHNWDEDNCSIDETGPEPT